MPVWLYCSTATMIEEENTYLIRRCCIDMMNAGSDDRKIDAGS